MRVKKFKRFSSEEQTSKPTKNPPKKVGIINKVRQIFKDPNMSVQLVVVVLTLLSDNMKMDRRIDNMTTSIDKMRSITQVITNTMNSMKTAAQAPKEISRLIKS